MGIGWSEEGPIAVDAWRVIGAGEGFVGEVSACCCSLEFKGETGLADSLLGEFREFSTDGLDTVACGAEVDAAVVGGGFFAVSSVLISSGVDAAGSSTFGRWVDSSEGVIFCGSLFCMVAFCSSCSLDAIAAKVAQGGRSAMDSNCS